MFYAQSTGAVISARSAVWESVFSIKVREYSDRDTGSLQSPLVLLELRLTLNHVMASAVVDRYQIVYRLFPVPVDAPLCSAQLYNVCNMSVY